MTTTTPVSFSMGNAHRVCHELRRPLAVISAFAELLADEISGPLKEEQQDYVQRILAATDGLTERFSDLMGFAEMGLEEVVCIPDQVDLVELCQELQTHFVPRYVSAGLELVFNRAKHATCIETDRQRLYQALAAILENALACAPDQSQVTLQLSTHDRSPRVSISNSGRSVHGADLELMFIPFHRLGSDGIARFGDQGIGLGLALCRANVEALGGRVWAEAPDSGGMCFHIDLPMPPL